MAFDDNCFFGGDSCAVAYLRQIAPIAERFSVFCCQDLKAVKCYAASILDAAPLKVNFGFLRRHLA